jgi:hypothetical protein
MNSPTRYLCALSTLLLYHQTAKYSRFLYPQQNKTKQNKTKQNKTKQNKTKQNKTKQNKTKQMLESSEPQGNKRWQKYTYDRTKKFNEP